MAFFGKYLVDQKFIDKDQLVGCLLEQMEAIPPLPKIAMSEGIFSPDDILNAFEVQQSEQIGFIEACRNLGIWSTEVEQKLSEKIVSMRPPLGKILIEGGHLEFNKLAVALDELFTDKSKTMPRTPKVESTQVKKPDTKESTEQKTQEAEHDKPQKESTNVDKVPTKEVKATFDPMLVNEFCKLFSDEKKDNLIESLDLVESSLDEDQSSKNMKIIMNDFQTLRAAARFLGAKKIFNLFDQLSGYLKDVSNDGTRSTSSAVIIKENLKKGIELSWMIRQHINQHKEEETIESNREFKELRFDLDSNLKQAS